MLARSRGAGEADHRQRRHRALAGLMARPPRAHGLKAPQQCGHHDQECGRQKERRLQDGRSGSFFTGFLSHSYGYGTANPAKTVLAGAAFRIDAFCRPHS